MRLTWNRSTGILEAPGIEARAWSKVRNEINGYRPNSEKVANGNPDLFRITRPDGSEGPPSMPRPFPAGTWRVTRINPHPDQAHDGYLYPLFVATDAHQPLEIWELDERGFYLRGTGSHMEDYAYGLHFSSSDWTQGCLRVDTEEHIRALAALIRPALARGDLVELEAI